LGTESFYIISEFAVGVAGFSAIVIAIGNRADEMDALARFRVLTLLSSALTACGFSLFIWMDSGSFSQLLNRIDQAASRHS